MAVPSWGVLDEAKMLIVKGPILMPEAIAEAGEGMQPVQLPTPTKAELRAAKAAYMREWYRKNRERARASRRIQNAKDPEKIRAQRAAATRKWQAKNPERRYARERARKAKNPEKEIARNREWRARRRLAELARGMEGVLGRLDTNKRTEP